MRLCGRCFTVAVLDSSKGINKGSNGSNWVNPFPALVLNFGIFVHLNPTHPSHSVCLSYDFSSKVFFCYKIVRSNRKKGEEKWPKRGSMSENANEANPLKRAHLTCEELKKKRGKSLATCTCPQTEEERVAS